MLAITLKRMSLLVVLAAQAACGGGTQEAAAPPAAAHDAIREVGGLTPAEVRDYRLTMEKVEAWHRAELDATSSFIKNPSLQPKDEHQEGTEPDQILKALEANPTIAAALRAQGLTAREATKLMLGMTHAGMAATLPAGTALPAEVTAENVEFIRAHRAELDRMRQETSTLQAQIPDEVAEAGDDDAIRPV